MFVVCWKYIGKFGGNGNLLHQMYRKKDSLFSYTGTNHLLAIVVEEISK